jgi:glycosyltransferase involved in cell wall biosynthesis
MMFSGRPSPASLAQGGSTSRRRLPHVLRVCFVVESGTDVRMIEGLAERFELSVIVRKIEGGVEISHPPEKAVPTHTGPPSRVGFVRTVYGMLRRDSRSIDYVLVQGYALAALAANVAARFTRIPTAMLVCSPAELYYQCREINPAPDKPFRMREMLALQALARANATLGRRYFVLSEHLAETVRNHGTARNVDVVPVYGVDTRLFVPPSETKATLKARAGLPASGSLIFFSSRIAPEKDAGTLLAAVASLLARGRDVWLLHRSGGYREFVSEAEGFGVAGRVIATDAVHPEHGLVHDYQASDLCIQASRQEGLGFSPLEAMSCHVPVIAAAVGGLKEIVVGACTGWTYPVGNPEALASRVEEVLDNPAEAERRAAAGREMVRRLYDRQVVFDRLETLIRDDCLEL